MLSFTKKTAWTDTNTDGITDGQYNQWELPTMQTNGQPIPVNTWITLETPNLVNLATGGTILASKNDRYRRDGTQRVDEVVNPI